MLNLKRGKGFQKSAANPLLKTLLEGRKIRAVHFRSLSSRAEKSVLSIFEASLVGRKNPFCPVGGLIWRAPGTRYHQENTIERHHYGAAGWLVWRGIILGSRTDLYVQSVTMTSHIYRDVILEQHVRLFRGATVTEFCLWMTTPVLTVQSL
ncbi:uncharacterized protein TNCV_2538221 [Trichonephila clavipes]|nr:uncharacterized protein TNCV_2538221 [Trichonephila clavipes]